MLKSFEVIEKLSGTEPCCFTLSYESCEANWSNENEHVTETLQSGSSLDFMASSEIAKICWIDSLSALVPILPSEKKAEDSVQNTEEEQGQAEVVEPALKSETSKMEETIYIEREHIAQEKSDIDIGSALWTVFSQVGPGMNVETLSLPYAIIEPRSFLDKFADFLLHIDILSQAAAENDPLMRMKLVTKWYLSGFYMQPKEMKKPFTPKQGEIFRCYWYHPKTESKTFYIAEQVKKNPSETAFYITNQKDGFCISGSTVTTVSFSGNSITAGVEEKASVVLFPFNERYTLGMPDAQCSGILLGNVALELVGEVCLNCAESLYSANIDFKTKPFFGGTNGLNQIEGEIKFSGRTVATIKGHWDGTIYLSDENEQDQLFWDPESVLTENLLKQFVVPITMQEPYESERLWLPVTIAIQNCDQEAVDQETQKITNNINSYTQPRLFSLDERENIWVYKYEKLHSWDPKIHNYQFENNFIIQSGNHAEDYKPPTAKKVEDYKLPITIPSDVVVDISSSKDALPIESQVHKLLGSLDELHEKYALLLKGLEMYADTLKTHEGTHVEEDARDKRTLCIFIIICLIKIALSLVQNW